MSLDIRILLIADSHLGFDLPARPRVGRRRRGYDFLANYAAALQPASDGDVDLVVHAGDVFDRPSVAPALAYQALEPLRRVADAGVPVFIVPGNHERSRLPHARFASHPRVHVFDSPRTFVAEVRGMRVALSGFPYERHEVRARFSALVEATGWRDAPADARVLCIHHCVEGATVGPGDFTFTTADDVIRPREVPPDFAAVCSGHIHRHQVLTTDLQRRAIATPVLYPGSIERTSFAEADEPKGFLLVQLGKGDSGVRWEFRHLPARPMCREDIVVVDGMSATAFESAIQVCIEAAPHDAVLGIRVAGTLSDEHWRVLSAGRLRTLVPETMNVEIRPTEGYDRARSGARRLADARTTPQLGLYDSLPMGTTCDIC